MSALGNHTFSKLRNGPKWWTFIKFYNFQELDEKVEDDEQKEILLIGDVGALDSQGNSVTF